MSLPGSSSTGTSIVTPPPTSSSSSSVSSSSSPTSSSSSSSSSTSPIGSSSSISSSSSTSTSSSSPSTSSTLVPSPTSLSPTSASTSTYETISITTSDGQVFTTLVTATTVQSPSLASSASAHTSKSNINVGALVGGIVGGIGGLIALSLLIWFLLRKKRFRDEFDGNFDPAHVTNEGKGGEGGATLPRFDVEEDDGMGGRLNTGVNGGGIISPYAYNPSTNMNGVGSPPFVATAPNNSHYANVGGPSSTPSSDFMSTPGGYPSIMNQYVNPIGRGPSPGSSAIGSGSDHSSYGAAGGVYNPPSAKAMEAMGMRAPHVANPDDQARQAYLQYGPGGRGMMGNTSPPPQLQQQYYGSQPSVSGGASSSSASASASRLRDDAMAGPGVIVHQDSGRVVVQKPEEPLNEIPPTYDSLVQAQRHLGEQ